MKVNCAALPSELLESELFGFEKGAFTGAQKRKLGKFELRRTSGTIFLDEISEMHPACRRSCCRCCRTASSRGSAARPTSTSTRAIIAATNRNLEEAVARGSASARISTTG